jgi:hypothetical protein
MGAVVPGEGEGPTGPGGEKFFRLPDICPNRKEKGEESYRRISHFHAHEISSQKIAKGENAFYYC